ncbi:TrkH family potassium uptake protein [Ramlibacter rhizophilus]|uniref:TrkH family potassium uptake protein n=1 Tax=Ramlibacter rhizophilus TaxID=1781167 RepID=A0A4Z0BMD1_9BURK|nr:potassium transporter TrkG [Ramlibacter rhizophilus]TFY99941.1 TrkH family potassium uptake protein [Ramlibacter rhizophilus]
MRTLLHPTRAVAMAFLLAIALGTLLLMLPVATATGEPPPTVTAFFTAVSAVCVTGLVVVDTGTYWSPFGQVVILLLFQAGGFGFMTGATLLGVMVNRSLRLRTRLVTQVEAHVIGLGDVASVARLVLVVTAVCELLIAAILAARLHAWYGLGWGEAAWNAVFHAVSAFNNAGFSIHEDSVMRYGRDGWILVPLMFGIIVGGIGFPVLHDLRLRLRDPRHWSLHSKLTLLGTGILLAVGFVLVLWFEWTNPATLGPMPLGEKVLNAAFASVSARTAGFNSLDISALYRETWALHYPLMFIGAGSAGTAGGVKVGTVFILVLLVFSEIRGLPDNEAFGRRISTTAQRQAITVLVLGALLVTAGTMILLRLTPYSADRVIFEVISAFATVGLSTGITADIPPAGLLVLTVLMYAGRVGTITLAAALVLGRRRMPYRYAEEHPIVG